MNLKSNRSKQAVEHSRAGRIASLLFAVLVAGARTAMGQPYTVLHDFNGPPDGAAPYGALTLASDGFFYGTTQYGGASDLGTVFRTDAAGNLSILYEFGSVADDASRPAGALLEASDGRFYGTAYEGGANSLGAIFVLDVAGPPSVAVLYSLGAAAGDADTPNSTLVEDPGAPLTFYGTSFAGGANGLGTVFRFSLPGGVPTFDVLHSFDGTDGSLPWAELLLASDGNYYSTTANGGDFGDAGTAFRLSFPAGVPTVTSIHSFDVGTDGAKPHAGLVEKDGVLYGTTTQGGVNDQGAIYSMTFAGATTLLHSFAGTDVGGDADDGDNPEAAMIVAADGDLYGTTEFGGDLDVGTVFRMHLEGGGGATVSVLHSFDGTQGATPYTALVQGADEAFYGVAFRGTADDLGVVFRFFACVPPTAAASGSATICEGGSTPLTGSGGTSCSWTPATGLSDAASCTPTASPATTTIYTLAVTDANGCISVNAPTVTVTVNPAPTAAASGSATICAGESAPLTGSGGVSCAWVPAAGLSDAASCAPTASPSATTTYTLTVTDAAGCASTNAPTVTVTVNPAPTATVSGSTAICTGGSAEIQAALTGTGPWSLTWSDGFVQNNVAASPATRTVSPATTTIYTVTALTDALCAGSGTGSAEVTVGSTIPAPTITVANSAAVGATGLPASTENHGGSTYAWTLTGGTITSGQGTASITFDAGEPGTTMSLEVVETAAACVSPAGSEKVQVDFLDVPPSHIFHDYVNTIARNAVTAGCGNGNYCPSAFNTRAQMAVFLLKGSLGSDYVPPPATGTVFADVPANSFAAAWIEDLASRGITGGCGGGNYCPGNSVTRAQMAVFLLKALLGSSYVPPTAVGIFADVPVGSFAADWIEDLYNRNVTGGCAVSPLRYCPDNFVTRGQMAVFLTKTFGLE